MGLGAGILVTLATGASVAGWWLLVAVVVAALAAFGSMRTVAYAQSTMEGANARLLSAVGGAGRLALVPLAAVSFAAYLVPSHPVLAAVTVVTVVTVVTAADAAGLDFARYARGWVLALLLLALAVLVVLCTAITPLRLSEGGAHANVAIAAVALFPLLARAPGKHAGWWLTGTAVAAAVLSAAALYQLGPLRLGLSPAPLRDVLAAADALAIDPWLAAATALATVGGAFAALGAGRLGLAPEGSRPRAALACGAAAALAAALLQPGSAVFFAAGFALLEPVVAIVLLAGIRYRGGRG
ncbi:hypothetical protein [Amycolatopsis minnesotensis]|uniref:Uncharacterized protein n=1 Tax=Amycolatopsis minnesotensis TaxID=337894 RepID=A0ABP5DKT5_9PSEU